MFCNYVLVIYPGAKLTFLEESIAALPHCTSLPTFTHVSVNFNGLFRGMLFQPIFSQTYLVTEQVFNKSDPIL